MPGYGIAGPAEGGGLLAWRCAEERLASSPRHWVTSVGPAGQSHAMPVWGVWLAGSLGFSTGGRSRKACDLGVDPRCVASTEDAAEPAVLEGTAQAFRDAAGVPEVLDADEAKYGGARPTGRDPIFAVRPAQTSD